MRALLVSTYDLGRQPFGLASPAAWLRRAGVEVDCADTSRDPLDDRRMAAASVIAFYLPMHTATRMAGPLIARARRVNPSATLCAYGLYAPLNAEWLRECGINHVFGPEAEEQLVALVNAQCSMANAQDPKPGAQSPEPTAQSSEPTAQRLPRLHFIQPDRQQLPALDRYASLQMPDGTLRVMGSTDATRGCKHLCRHCPVVPVYNGHFRVVPIDIVIEDIRAQVAAGAEHVSFGDADFFNGPTHARRLVERFAAEFPGVTYDATIKIEHLIAHAELLPVLHDTGCLFITSAVESIDDEVLAKLRKGHTRADFIWAVARCREAGLQLTPTFIPFTPWMTLEAYVELLELIEELQLAEAVAPIQLAIRLLVTAGSPLLELADIAAAVQPFDARSLTWPWRHPDPRVDDLHEAVMSLARRMGSAPRSDVFDAISALARRAVGLSSAPPVHRVAAAPRVTEPWYCCAEPMETV
jgi:radical SAM superfamily enzyme YgiQ (UPF0313 family)